MHAHPISKAGMSLCADAHIHRLLMTPATQLPTTASMCLVGCTLPRQHIKLSCTLSLPLWQGRIRPSTKLVATVACGMHAGLPGQCAH